MAEEEKKSSNKKVIIILLIIVIVLLIGGGVTALVLLNGSRGSGESNSMPTMSNGQIPLEVNAGVLSPDQMAEWNSEALQQAEDNQIPINYAPIANSVDGKNFACEIGNPDGAKYYFYLDLYSDTTLSEEVYLSGLIPPGRGVTSFQTNKEFPKGETDAVLVITTVQDDRSTIVAQTMVVLTLNVGDE